MLCISMKFHENILNSFQVIERTQNYHCRNSKGNNSKKVLTRDMVLVFCTLYISTKFHENILNSFQVIEQTQNCQSQISKGNNSKNVLTRVSVLVLCMSSNDHLYFYEVSLKYFKQFSGYTADTKFPLSNFKGE